MLIFDARLNPLSLLALGMAYVEHRIPSASWQICWEIQKLKKKREYRGWSGIPVRKAFDRRLAV